MFCCYFSEFRQYPFDFSCILWVVDPIVDASAYSSRLSILCTSSFCSSLVANLQTEQSTTRYGLHRCAAEVAPERRNERQVLSDKQGGGQDLPRILLITGSRSMSSHSISSRKLSSSILALSVYALVVQVFVIQALFVYI